MNIFEKRRKIEEKNHAEALKKLNEIGWRLEWEPRFRKFLEYLGKDREAKILDLGCGVTSTFLRLIKKEGFKNLLGLELTRAASCEARKKGIRVLVGDLEQDGFTKLFGKQKFDFIILGETIEHLVFPKKALKKIRKILKPEGRLILSTPNADYFTNKILLRLFPGYLKYFSTSYGPKEHLHHFTTTSLIKLLRETGFEVEEFFGLPHAVRRPVKKSLAVKVVVNIENLVYLITNLFTNFSPSLFVQYLVMKAKVKKGGSNEK